MNKKLLFPLRSRSKSFHLHAQNMLYTDFAFCYFLVALTCASPTEQNDGTISYFNNHYRSQHTENSSDTEVYYNSHRTEPMHKAKVGVDGIESRICTTKRAAMRDAINLYLRQKGGEDEVRRAEMYRGKLSLLVDAELNKQKAATVFQFGQRLDIEENQWLELKSSRNGHPDDTPPLEPYLHASLRRSIIRHLTKYAAAFLNAQCVYPHLKRTSTLIFGVHDDHSVDGYLTTDEEKDQTTRIINDLLDLLIRQSFERSIEWYPVLYGAEESHAYVVHVSVTPISPQLYCLDSPSREYTLWMRRDNQCKKMTFEEMAVGFKNTRL